MHVTKALTLLAELRELLATALQAWFDIGAVSPRAVGRHVAPAALCACRALLDVDVRCDFVRVLMAVVPASSTGSHSAKQLLARSALLRKTQRHDLQ